MDTVKVKKNYWNTASIKSKFDSLKSNKLLSIIEDALKEESKNSAGDKYETNRPCIKSIENAGKQLMEIEKLQWFTNLINIHETSDYIRLGSLVPQQILFIL